MSYTNISASEKPAFTSTRNTINISTKAAFIESRIQLNDTYKAVFTPAGHETIS